MFMAFAFLACSKSENTPQSNAKFDSETELFLNQDLALTNNSETASIYLWDFGDGTKSTEKEPKHVYSKAGNYTVTLTTNGNSTVTKSVKVYDTTHSVVIKNNTSNSFRINLFDRIDENTIGGERFRIQELKAGETSKQFFTNKTKISFGGWNSSGFNFVCLEPIFNVMLVGQKNIITIDNNTKVVYGLTVPN